MSPMNRRIFAKAGLGAVVAALPLGSRAIAAVPADLSSPVVEIVDDQDSAALPQPAKYAWHETYDIREIRPDDLELPGQMIAESVKGWKTALCMAISFARQGHDIGIWPWLSDKYRNGEFVGPRRGPFERRIMPGARKYDETFYQALKRDAAGELLEIRAADAHHVRQVCEMYTQGSDMRDMPTVADRLHVALVEAARVGAERDRIVVEWRDADDNGKGWDYFNTLGLRLDPRIA